MKSFTPLSMGIKIVVDKWPGEAYGNITFYKSGKEAVAMKSKEIKYYNYSDGRIYQLHNLFYRIASGKSML